MAIPDELLKLMQGPQFGQPQAPAAFPAAPAAPQAPIPRAGPIADPHGRAPQDILATQQRIADTSIPVAGPSALQSAGQGIAESPFFNPQTRSGGFAGIEEGLAEAMGQPERAEPIAPPDPFGVTPEQIAAAGNASFGLASAQPSTPVPSGSLGTVPFDPTLPVPQVSQENIAGAQGPLADTIQPTAPTAFQSPGASGLTTTGGQPLAEFLAGGQQLDPQGRMIDPNVDRSFFEQQSAAREQRAADQFGVARGPDARDREAGELSMAEAVDLAGGDRDAARAMVVQSRQGGSPLTVEQQIAERRQRLAESRFEFDLTKEAQSANEAAIKEAKTAKTEEAKAASSGKAFTQSVSDLRETMGRMAQRSDEFFGSGLVGKAGSFIPGTTGHSQMADAEFIQSNVALNAMQELKRLSPTGSTGFGALNQKELETLQNQFANLNPFVDAELFRKNMGQLNRRFETMIDTARETHAAEFGQEAADAVYGTKGESSGSDSQAVEPQTLTSPTGGTFTVVQRT